MSILIIVYFYRPRKMVGAVKGKIYCMKKLMLGNEAFARGLYEAGCKVVSSYPGTPSTEITEAVAKYDEVYAEWAPNEKVAMEVALGASIGGARSFCGMKHVGLNVAADPLFTASYTGVNGGMVLAVADDPGMHSSQNEQDSRHYAIGAKVPMLEPSDSQECKDYAKLAYEISEKFDTPVILRLTTRVSHSQSAVTTADRIPHTIPEYKKNIAKNQTAEDYCILNYEDERTREFGEHIDAQVIYFSSRQKLEKGIYLDNGNMIYKNPEEVLVCNVDELQLLGMHNYENYMAAVAMAAVYGVPMDIIRKVIRAFKGVEHRIEYVTEKNGVVYYNDSKGTNPDAAIKGIQAMNRRTVLLGGGYDKGSEFTEWINAFDGKVKKLILIGATKEKIAADAEKCGFHDYVFADTFEEAVLLAAKTAESGEAVLLSPACASWGMFPNYEVRGDEFKRIVNSL